MKFKKFGELILGIIIIAIGLLYFGFTTSIPRKGIIDATFVPHTLFVLIFILGILQLRAGYKKAKNFTGEANQNVMEEKPDYLTVLKTSSLIVLYVTLIDMIGFLSMTALYLFAQFIVLTPTDKKKNYISYAGIAIATSIVIYFTFRNVFDLMLPESIL